MEKDFEDGDDEDLRRRCITINIPEDSTWEDYQNVKEKLLREKRAKEMNLSPDTTWNVLEATAAERHKARQEAEAAEKAEEV